MSTTTSISASSSSAAEAQHQKDITSWAGKDGEFKRLPSTFRTTELGGDHLVEKGRYVLYVSLACPWAHRTMIVRELKGLHEYIDLSVVHPHMGALGWSFYPPIRKLYSRSLNLASFKLILTNHAFPGGENGEYPATTGDVGKDDGIAQVIKDPLYDSKFIRELYFKANPDYAGRFTVPILWDKKLHTIVNNESSEIIRFVPVFLSRDFDPIGLTFCYITYRMMNTQFNSVLAPEFASLDLYPAALQSAIEEQNAWVYETVRLTFSSRCPLTLCLYLKYFRSIMVSTDLDSLLQLKLMKLL